MDQQESQGELVSQDQQRIVGSRANVPVLRCVTSNASHNPEINILHTIKNPEIPSEK